MEHRDLHRVIGWFITIRWVAVVGVPLTLLLARHILGLDLAYTQLYITAVALAVINLAFTVLYLRKSDQQWARVHYFALFHVQILADYAILTLLLYFSGFLENPFMYFFVFHIMLTSFIFPARTVWMYVGGLVIVLAGTAAAECTGILPHFPFGGQSVDAYRTDMLPRAAALVATLAISAYLITSIRSRIEEKGRAVEIELNRYRTLDKVKSNFILQVTHELRGPIAAVSGFHDMVLRGITGDISDGTGSALKKAQRRTENLLTIIDEMIDYAYMRSDDEVRYRSTQINLEKTVADIVDLHTAHAEEKRIRLRCDCEPGLVAIASRDLLKILLGNLINNAIKYSPEQTMVRVAVRREGSELLLQVIDQGYGIEADQLEQIFEEFYRTRQARELERDGTGLGLPIVKRAVESLGGKIRVYSKPGHGTKFDIRFPAADAQPATAAEGDADEDDPDH